MLILDLPVEIFDLILDLTLPDGIENFALSCKAVYNRAQSYIRLHNTLRQWRHTTNSGGVEHTDVLGIIFRISREPLIAQYINTLYLWDQRRILTNRPLTSIDNDFFDYRTNDTAMARIKDLFSQSRLFSESDLDEYWQSIIEDEPADGGINRGTLYATMLLLSLLPNLRELQLPEGWYQVRQGEAGEDLLPLAHSLVELSNARRLPWKGLTHLETLFPFVEENYEYRIALQCLQPFMVLENIQNLYAVSCVANKQDWEAVPFDWPDPKMQSPLTRIELAYCCIDAPGLASLLAYTPALKIFRYSHQTKWDELGYDWNPGEFLETIANFCGDQLLELALTIDNLRGDVANGLSSFVRLPKLEKLEVDVKSFCGPPLESGQRLGRNAIVPPEGTKAWVQHDIPCIGSMLPATIREVHVNALHPGDVDVALKALFKNIMTLRAESLLLLHTLVIRQCGTGIWEQGIADGYGITLEIFKVPHSWPPSMMPLWKREFDETVGGIAWGRDY